MLAAAASTWLLRSRVLPVGGQLDQRLDLRLTRSSSRAAKSAFFTAF